jgi:prefoldin subunit 5
MGSYYIKVKELYSLLELCENFDQVFEYVTKRFKAIKNIHEQSDQYNSLVEDLNKNLNKVEEKYSNLKSKYQNVMEEFSKYQEVLKNLENLEKKVQAKLLI